jgi:hypothetical protein
MPIRTMKCILVYTGTNRRTIMMGFSYQINEVMHLYNRVSKLKTSAILEKDQGGPQDFVNISSEGEKRQIMDQARTDVLDNIRKTK